MDSLNENAKTCDLRKEEYCSLREEIHKNNENSLKIISSTFAITGAAFAYVFTKEQINPYVFLFPYIILIPSVLLITSLIESTKRIAAYINVFIENEANVQWESRLIKLENHDIESRNHNAKRGILLMYILAGCLCDILYFMEVRSKGLDLIDVALLIVPFVLLMLFLFNYKKTNTLWGKNNFIKDWETLKEIENERKMIEV